MKTSFTRRSFGKAAAAGFAAVSISQAAPQPFDDPWKLGVISDEVDFDINRTLTDFGPRYGLHWLELRNVKIDGSNKYLYRDATPAQIRELKKQIDGAGMQVSVLDTAVYKIPLPGTTPVGANKQDLHPNDSHYASQIDELKRGAEAAHGLGTKVVRIFTFLRVPDPNAIFTRIVDELGKAIEVAKQQDVTLVIENEFSCNTATAAESAQLFRAIPDRTLMHNWDSGNCYEAGEEPFPKGWDELDYSRIIHLHLKDAKGKSWKPIGSGDIDFKGQFEALKKLRYSGTLSLETHYRNAEKNLYNSSVESMDGLVKVLREV